MTLNFPVAIPYDRLVAHAQSLRELSGGRRVDVLVARPGFPFALATDAFLSGTTLVVVVELPDAPVGAICNVGLGDRDRLGRLDAAAIGPVLDALPAALAREVAAKLRAEADRERGEADAWERCVADRRAYADALDAAADAATTPRDPAEEPTR